MPTPPAISRRHPPGRASHHRSGPRCGPSRPDTINFSAPDCKGGAAIPAELTCDGAGRAMSRHEALRRWRGRQVIDDLASKGIVIRSHSSRGVAEEAPGAYKDVSAVVDAAHDAGLARKVARSVPLVCVKG